ncbi:phosphatase PAP2 family protein [Micromonospora lupini]|uniref:Membrane-associated phospholipid phosphatase n=1 Tax=Micromonospora lupini str. Lupac 08 TaxID=1150864 RepID=I0L1Q3_9ACTN|nr:Membrane-associated phospholipid phosphatase [Micromonospora lupini str. Lupac 08]
MRPEDCLAFVFLIGVITLSVLSREVPSLLDSLLGLWPVVVVLGSASVPVYWYGCRHGGGRPHGRRLVRKTAREVAPAVFCLSFYLMLHHLTPDLDRPLLDPRLSSLDRSIFGGDAGVWLQRRVGSDMTTAILTGCYLSVAIVPAAYTALLYLRSHYQHFREVVLAVTTCMLSSYAVYLVSPAVGPHVYRGPVGVNLVSNESRAPALRMIAVIQGDARDAFPSVHAAVVFVILWYMFRNYRKLFWSFLPVGIGVVLATVYLEVHYFIDVVAGAAAAAAGILSATVYARIQGFEPARLAPERARH